MSFFHGTRSGSGCLYGSARSPPPHHFTPPNARETSRTSGGTEGPSPRWLCAPGHRGTPLRHRAVTAREEQRERESPSGTTVISADISGLKADFVNNKGSWGGDRERQVGRQAGFLFCEEMCGTAGCREECIRLPCAEIALVAPEVLKPWKRPQTAMQITRVRERCPTVAIAEEIHVQSALPELLSSETSIAFAGNRKREGIRHLSHLPGQESNSITQKT